MEVGEKNIGPKVAESGNERDIFLFSKMLALKNNGDK